MTRGLKVAAAHLRNSAVRSAAEIRGRSHGTLMVPAWEEGSGSSARSESDRPAPSLRRDSALLLVPSLLKFLLQLLTAKGYGLNGDELYYLACSGRLDWGFVDHPPLSLGLLWLERQLLGDSVVAIRFLPALAGFFTVLLTGMLARRLGAGRFGQVLAATCALVAPLYLGINHYFSMNAFDVLFWLGMLFLIVCILDGGKPKLWLWFGVIAGLGLENKISVLFLAFAIVAALLLTQQRRLLFSRWALLGGLVAAAIFLPHVVWQIRHGWPTVEFMQNATAQKMAALSLPAYLQEQVLLMHPLTVPVWLIGLFALLLHPHLRRFHPLGLCYVVVLGLFLAMGGKPYYLGPIYPILFGAGAVVIERWIARTSVRIALIGALLIGGAVTSPMALPILPVETYIRYAETLGIKPSSLGERTKLDRLPANYASMFGWERFVQVVADVYRSLPPEDRARSGIWCQNYHEAGAVDFYGRSYALPAAIAPHNNYYLWGTRGYSGEVMIVVGGTAEWWKRIFEDVTEEGFFHDEYAQPSMNDLPIYVARRAKRPLPAIWSQFKEYI